MLGNNVNPDKGSHAETKPRIDQLNLRHHGIAIGWLTIMLTATTALSTQKNRQILTEDIQQWIYHYGFILQQDTKVQGWITKLLKGH